MVLAMITNCQVLFRLVANSSYRKGGIWNKNDRNVTVLAIQACEDGMTVKDVKGPWYQKSSAAPSVCRSGFDYVTANNCTERNL